MAAPKLIQTVPLVLCILLAGAHGRTWIPHSPTTGRRQHSSSSWMTPSTTWSRPLFVRGSGNHKIPSDAIFQRANSNIHLLGARGGHSTHHLEEDDEHSSSTQPLSTTTTTTSTTTTTPSSPCTTTSSSSSNAIQHGGAIEITHKAADANRTTTTATTRPSSSSTPTKELSPRAAAKQEAKAQRKKEKEAKKRHKQIAKQLRVRRQ
jgi:hypothetical protein